MEKSKYSVGDIVNHAHHEDRPDLRNGVIIVVDRASESYYDYEVYWPALACTRLHWGVYLTSASVGNSTTAQNKEHSGEE